jgi:hypothetical protein
MVKLLLQAGADPAIKDNDGDTALEYARIHKRTEVVRLLEVRGGGGGVGRVRALSWWEASPSASRPWAWAQACACARACMCVRTWLGVGVGGRHGGVAEGEAEPSSGKRACRFRCGHGYIGA